MTKGIGIAIFGVLSMLAIGCSGDASPGSEPSEEIGVNRAELEVQAESVLRQYVSSLVNRDEESLAAVVSDEILERAEKYQGLAAFLEKQRSSLVNQYGDDPDLASNVSVGKAVLEGNVVTADIGVDGVAILKPWYFVVADDGSLKLSVVLPGFTRPLPPGAVAASNYLVTASGGQVQFSTSVRCSNPGRSCTISYPGGPTQCTVSCNNTCGFWTGTTFDYAGKCDWNSWGTDVYTNGSQTWCNDRC